MGKLHNSNYFYIWSMAVLVISVVAVVQVIFEVLYFPQQHIVDLLATWDYLICSVFFIDFIFQFYYSNFRWRYLYTWGWIDLLSCIPVIQGLQTLRLFRVFRLIKAVRSLRASLRVLMHPGSILMVTLIIVIALWFLGALLVLCFEGVDSNANITEADDALWWGVVTLATVGYGDYVPLTLGGRIVGGIMMTFGVITYGVLTGFIVSYFTQRREQNERNLYGRLRKSLNETNARLDRMEKMLEEIREEKRARKD